LGVLDVRSFRAADCDTDRYLVVANVRERLAVNKQGSHTFHMERFNLKKLNEVEGKVKYHVEVSNRFAALKIWTLRWKLIALQEIDITFSGKDTLGFYDLKKQKERGISENKMAELARLEAVNSFKPRYRYNSAAVQLPLGARHKTPVCPEPQNRLAVCEAVWLGTQMGQAWQRAFCTWPEDARTFQTAQRGMVGQRDRDWDVHVRREAVPQCPGVPVARCPAVCLK
jgi:hypothetical protein